MNACDQVYLENQSEAEEIRRVEAMSEKERNGEPAPKKRRTAVERAQESLEKAKAKARARILKQALAHIKEAHDLLNAVEANDIEADGGYGVIDFTSTILVSLRKELGE